MGLIEKNISLNHILIETDSPYLAPVPYRGKINEPAYVEKVAEKIAEIKNLSAKEVIDITTNNANVLFKKIVTWKYHQEKNGVKIF